jgi:enoyl-CoA hydratase/carnithine racemase
MEPREIDEPQHPHGAVRTDVVDEHILVMTVDRVAKKNAFTPKITTELGEALTRLDEDAELFVGVLCFAGPHTTAGLEMPLFFTDEARAEAARRARERTSEPVDPFGLGRRLRKPLVTAVQGITFTIGIEIALAGDIVVASADARFCQLEPKRGLAPLGGATVRYVQRAGWGNAMYHLLRADEFDAAEAYRIGLVQEVVEPGAQVDRAVDLAREMVRCAPLGLVHTIANARLALDHDEQTAIAAIPEMSAAVLATEDFQEGIASFLERRPAQFTGR